jgi:carbon storage regulator
MLVLTRKRYESIVINGDVIITIIEIRGDKVRLGIVAPRDVPVHREEIFEMLTGQKLAPGELPPTPPAEPQPPRA